EEIIMSMNSVLERTEKANKASIDMAGLDPKKAVGYRGFVSPLPKPDLHTMIECTLRGFMYWGQRVHVVKDFEQALEHHNNLTIKDGKTDILMSAFYIISEIEPAHLEEISKKSRKEITEFFSKESSKGIYYLYDNKWVQVEGQLIERCFIEVDIIMINPKEGFFFYQRGWFAPAIRGVIKFSRIDNSKTVKKILFFSRNLYRKGFHVTFNQDIEAVMIGCRDQARKGQGRGAGTRITDDLMKSYVELLKLGKAYSVELRDPEGSVIAGIFGFVGDGELACDSIFYPATEQVNCENTTKEDFKSHIDYAKVTMVALFDRAKAIGYKFIDLGMVTSFTQNVFKAEYIPRDEFFELLAASPKNVEIDFITDWNPVED
ncbi:MAG: hypothetical protein ACYDG2_23480, partial [Ruminiclostridium sp.]